MNASKRLGALLTMLAVAPAFAADGKIPVWGPTTITQPGYYVLTRGVTTPSDIDAITIESGGVFLDLNGHTIETSGAAASIRINLPSPGIAETGIQIRNGTLLGGDHGIAGIIMPNFLPAVMDALEIVTPSMHCIDLSGGSVTITGSKLRGCGGDGIRLIGPGGIVEIVGTEIAEVQGDGIEIAEFDSVTVRESVVNRFALNGAAEGGGIYNSDPGPGGLLIESTKISGGGTLGIGILLSGIVGPPCLVRGNSITANGQHGIEIREGRADIRENLIAENGGAGLLVGGQFVLMDGNYLIGNAGAGIQFMNGDGHAYRNLFVRDNSGGSIDDQFNNTDAGGNIE